MQWFIPTTEELHDRIEQIYRLESALARLDNLAAIIDNLVERIEKDLRPSKVQHEMRLRALEPLLEQIEDTDAFRADMQDQFDQSTAEIKKLRQEFTALKKISASKNEKFFEQTITELNGVRVELEELKKNALSAKEDQTAAEALAQVDQLRLELDGLKEKLSEPTIDPKLEQKVEQIEPRVEQIDQRIEQIDQRVEQIDQRIEQLHSAFEGLKEKVSEPTVDPRIEPTIEEMKRIRAELSEVRELTSNTPEPISIDELNRIANKFDSNLSAKDEEIKQLWQLFSERIEAKEAEIEQLRAQSKELSTQLETRDGAINELIRQIDYLWKKFDEVDEKFKALPSKSKSKAPVESANPSSEDEPKILMFEIERTGEVYINGTAEEITARLKAAMNVDEIKTFLDSSKAANKVIFLRSLDRHVRNLQKLTYKLNFNEYEGGQTSEEITKKYFEIFKLTLLESVTATSYRGMSRQLEFYREFLKHFNQYLQRCGIYTRRVLPNGRVTEQDLIDMKISRRETTKVANKDLIAEVERLPYYIDYVDADGGIRKLFFEGKMIAYSSSH